MDAKGVWNVLKWILAALAAGFVGHFGRVLAERLIARRRTARTEPRDADASPETRATLAAIKAEEKVEKKRLKAEQKREKKRDRPKD
jgi:hypothetical protein